MQDFEETDVVSSSGCQSEEVSFHGKLWMELDNAIVVDVEWRGRRFAGALIRGEAWAPQRPAQPRPKKVYKTWRKFKGSGAFLLPRALVDSRNIVDGKLRYGRDRAQPPRSGQRGEGSPLADEGPEELQHAPEPAEPSSDEGEKTYATLQNCDLSFLADWTPPSFAPLADDDGFY